MPLDLQPVPLRLPKLKNEMFEARKWTMA